MCRGCAVGRHCTSGRKTATQRRHWRWSRRARTCSAKPTMGTVQGSCFSQCSANRLRRMVLQEWYVAVHAQGNRAEPCIKTGVHEDRSRACPCWRRRVLQGPGWVCSRAATRTMHAALVSRSSVQRTVYSAGWSCEGVSWPCRRTALHYTSLTGHTPTALALVEAGAKVNCKCNDGYSLGLHLRVLGSSQ